MAAKKAEVIITCDGAQAKQVLEGINRELARAIKEREQLLQKQKQNGTLTQDEIKRDRELKKYIDSLTTAQQKSAQQMKKYADVMKDLAGSKTKDLKRALGEVKRALDNMSARDPGRAQLENDLKRIQKQIDANTVSLGKNKNAWGALGTTMKNLFAYAGIFAGFNMLKSKFEEVIQKNREMSDQLANIRKVSGLAMSDINGLTKNLAKIDTRSSVKELNDLAYVGAKLGFGNLGTEALESFVKSALKVNNALKEDLGEDSMMAISKLVEVMGLIPKMGVEKAMDSAGSAIFKLASTSTATGGNIIEFSKRLMGLANVSHITADQLLALGSASDAMGLMPEVSATAFNKVFTSIQSNTKAIEMSLDMQKGELADLINQGKTMEAIVTVFDKMHGMNMDELKAKGVFQALGSDGARLNNVMITMSDRIDMLKTHLHTSNQAFSEGSAVAQEYAIQMETAEAYMQRASNMWEKAFVNPEGVDLTKEFAKAWYDVSKSLTQTESNAATIKYILQGVFGIMKLIVEMIPAIIAGFSAWGLWAGGALLIKQLRDVSSLITTIITAVRGLSFAGWIGILTGVAMGVATLYSHFKSLNEELQRNSEYMKGFKKDLSDLTTEYGKGEAELRRYKKAIDEANIGSKQRSAAIQTFNSKFGQYMKNMLTEKSTALDVAKAYNEITKALRAKLALQLKEKDINDQVLPREQWRANARTEYDQRAKAAGLGQYGADWITGFAQDNQGKNINTLVKDIGKQYFNLPKQIIDEVAKQAAAGNREFNNYGNIINSKYLKQANALMAASSFLRQDRSAENAMRKVNNKWKPEQDAMDAYIAAQNQQEPITPLEDRPTKEELKEQRKAEAEYKQMIRKELQDAKRDSDAIIGKIEEWYRLQETVVTGFAADGKWTQEQAEMMNRELEAAKNEALANARLAISGRDTKTWERTKQNIRLLMFDTGKWSQELFDEMMNVSMQNIRNNIARIDAANVPGISTASLKDDIDKKAAGNKRKVQEIRNKTAKEVEKMLLKFNYYELAIKAFEDQLTALGLLTETAEEASRRINGLKASEKTEDQLTRERSTARRQAGEQFRQNPGESYNVNPDDTKSLQSWLQGFTGAQGTVGTNGFEWKFSGWAEAFKDDFSKWLTDSEKYKAQIQGFYLTLVDYDSQYYNAVRQHRDKMVKDAETSWEISGKGRLFSGAEKELNWESRRQKMTGEDQGTNFGQMAGFYNVNNDPEIQMSLLRMAQYDAELEAFKAENEGKKLEGAALDAYNQELFDREQQRKELERQAQEAVMQHINDHISKLEQWTQPVEQFGADMGAAFGKLVFEGESMADGMRSALQSMVQSWGQATIEIIKQIMMQQMKERLLGKATTKELKKTEKEKTDTVEQGGEERLKATTLLETGAASVVQQVGQMTLSQKQTQDAAESQQEAGKAQGSVLAGIAEGAAKIIGTLGPWGAPLIAVITALLMGLLNTALAALSGGSSSGGNSATTKRKVKLAQGMLTYDSGNVQTVLGDDGRVYHARQSGSLPEGVSMVNEPIVTRVNGQQALVGERGPEIVIGRKATRQMQMNRPDLLRAIALFDRGYTGHTVRTFDEGNLEDMATAIAAASPSATVPESAEGRAAQEARNAAMMQTLGQLAFTIGQLQQQLSDGIQASINMYGENGLHNKMKQADKFLSRYGR